MTANCASICGARTSSVIARSHLRGCARRRRQRDSPANLARPKASPVCGDPPPPRWSETRVDAVSLRPNAVGCRFASSRINSHVEITVIDNGCGCAGVSAARFSTAPQSDQSPTRATAASASPALRVQLIELQAGRFAPPLGRQSSGAAFHIQFAAAADPHGRRRAKGRK